MQLKITRSQRDAGIISKTAIFCIDARVVFTAEENRHIARYKLHKEVIYNSEASKNAFERSATARDGSVMGSVKSLAFAAMGAMKLNITIWSLTNGQHVECKSLEELLGAEEAIKLACLNLNTYLATASTFDGREDLYEVKDGELVVIARSVSPEPMLISAPQESAPVALTVPKSEAVVSQESVHEVTPNDNYGVTNSDSYENTNPTHKYVAFGLTGILLIAVVVATVDHTNKTGLEAPTEAQHAIETYDGLQFDPSGTAPYDYHPEVNNVPPGYQGPVFFNGQQMLIPFKTPAGVYIPPCKTYHQATGLRPDIVFGCDS